MKNLVPMDEYGVFADSAATVKVGSLFVAQVFEKEHRTVLRDIRNLDCSDKFRLHNFVQSSYRNEQGKRQPCVVMTRDGFTFLVMGYRGKKAAAFKEAYIERFNQMEEFTKTLVSARQDFPALTAAVQMAHDEPKPYHYSNECNLLCGLVTGMTAKQFRDAHGIPKGQSIRPYLSAEQIALLDVLQKVDVGLLVAVPDYQQRKGYLERYRDKAAAKGRLSRTEADPISSQRAQAGA